MSQVGRSADNALSESFNATFKRESLRGRLTFSDEREARLRSFRWLHRYNAAAPPNTVRRHSRLEQQINYEKNTKTAPATLAPAA